MWIVVPFSVIGIVFLLVSLGVFGAVQSNIAVINTILLVADAVIFIGIAIYNLTRDYISTGKKVASTIACGVLGTVSALVINFFVSAIAEIEFGLLGVIEFIFVLFMGGSLCLLVVVGCIYACCWFND